MATFINYAELTPVTWELFGGQFQRHGKFWENTASSCTPMHSLGITDKQSLKGRVLSPSLKYVNQQIFIVHTDSLMKVLTTYGFSWRSKIESSHPNYKWKKTPSSYTPVPPCVEVHVHHLQEDPWLCR